MDYSQISVIVRGLVVGTDQADERKKFTKRSLASIRKHLPGARIILSSWKGSDVSGLEYDELVLSDPPPAIFMVKQDSTRKFMAGNNQIAATQAGLNKVSRQYTLTMRSDIVLTGTGFIDYFSKFNTSKDGSIFAKRIVTLPTYNPRRLPAFLFNVCDWFFFGLTEDVRKLFDVPLMTEKDMRGEKLNGDYPYEDNFESEQYLWRTFLKKYQEVPLPYPRFFSEEALAASEESYARNLIMVPAQKANLVCLKMPHAGYSARPVLSQGLYTFNEYKKMYNRFSSTKITGAPNLLENILYSLLLNTRLLLKRLNPKGYKKIVNFVRKRHGSYEVLK